MPAVKTAAGARVDRTHELYAIWLESKFERGEFPTEEEQQEARDAAQKAAGASDEDFHKPQSIYFR